MLLDGMEMAMLQEARGHKEFLQHISKPGNTLAQCLGPVSTKINACTSYAFRNPLQAVSINLDEL